MTQTNTSVTFQLEKGVGGRSGWTYRYIAMSNGRLGSRARLQTYAGVLPIDTPSEITPEAMREVGRRVKRQPIMRYYVDTFAYDCFHAI